MSHIVIVKAQFKDLAVLKAAFDAFDWKTIQNSTIRTYSPEERKVVYDNVALNPTGKYDIGIVYKDNVYNLAVDHYDASISRQLGDKHGELAKLKRKYAQTLIEQEYEEQGYTTQTTVLPNGALKISILN